MTSENKATSTFELEELFDEDEIDDSYLEQNPFHLVGSLFPNQSISVTTVSPDTSVKEALNIMLNNGYSQLPVKSIGVYQGMVSLASICKCLKGVSPENNQPTKIPLGDIRVSDIMDSSIPTISPEDNIDNLINHLHRYEAVVMGNKNNIQAVATPIDLVNQLWQIAGPYIIAQEIELALRQIIRQLLPQPPEFEIHIQRPFRHKGNEIQTTLEEMDLDDLRSIIVDKENWRFFNNLFGYKPLFNTDARRIINLRNNVMHHKTRILIPDYNFMVEFRTKLLRYVRELSDDND